VFFFKSVDFLLSVVDNSFVVFELFQLAHHLRDVGFVFVHVGDGFVCFAEFHFLDFLVDDEFYCLVQIQWDINLQIFLCQISLQIYSIPATARTYSLWYQFQIICFNCLICQVEFDELSMSVLHDFEVNQLVQVSALLVFDEAFFDGVVASDVFLGYFVLDAALDVHAGVDGGVLAPEVAAEDEGFEVVAIEFRSL